MQRTDTSQTFTVLTLALLFVVADVAAEETTVEQRLQALSGMSGHVVDASGNAVAGFTFALQPMQLHAGNLQPVEAFPLDVQKPPEGMDGPEMPRTKSRVQTDSDGAFSVTDIQPGFVHLEVLPDLPLEMHKVLADVFPQGNMPLKEEIPPELIRLATLEPDKKIVSIQIGKVIFFNDVVGPAFLFEGLTFALKPGVTLENVKITVEPRRRIRARIVYADGTPLTNAEGRFNVRHRYEGNPGSGGNSLAASFFTDADGYFIEYVDEPGFYTLSVEYNNLSAGAGPFLLKDGRTAERLILVLEGNPVAAEPPPGPGDMDGGEPPVPPPATGVWIVNPANGHAYKKIACQNWHDAQRRAVEEGAHLVSITDEAEQHWIQIIFGNHPFWIGLTDVEEEGQWQWDSGEPVAYTNWATREIVPDKLADTEKDYVVLTFAGGQWQSVGYGGHLWRITRQAIIEKDGLVSTAPVVPASQEK